MDDRSKFLLLVGAVFVGLVVLPASTLGGSLVLVGVVVAIIALSAKGQM